MHVLQYGVRLPMLAKYFGQLCLALATLTVVPLGVSLLFGDYNVSIRYAIVVFVITALGLGLSRLRASGRMQNNEAMVISALIFLFSPLAMTWPIMGSGLDFSEALFEAISAITTTGLSTVKTLEDLSPTFLFSRAWMQWIGGLGIVVLSMAVLIQPGLTAKRLDVSIDFEEDIIGATRDVARRTLIIYTSLTAFGVMVLLLLGVGWYDAVLYCLSAISTGGFAPYDGSLSALDVPAARFAVIAICVSGGLPLLIYYKIYEKNWRAIIFNDQFLGYCAAAVVTVLLLACLLYSGTGLGGIAALWHGLLNGLSALSTAGFSSMAITDMDGASKLTLILAMSIGGCAGSTAGGIKIIRLLILFRLLYLVIQRAAAPSRAIIEPRLNGKKLGVDEMLNAICIFVLFTTVIAISWLPFLAMNHNPLDSLFEVVSALGTVGLSSGLTSAEMHPLLKGVLCLNMLLGRLEILVWLIFFHPGTWIGLKKED